LADLVAARGGHPSDVLADWVLEHDLAPGMVVEALSNNDPAAVATLVADPTTVVGASDAGAHLQMMCGAGDSTLLLTAHGRDRMEIRTLGATGVQVSSFCLGAMMFGRFGNTDHDECVRMMHRAFDAGINFVDTADVYSGGESEEIVAKGIKGRRDDLMIAT